MSGQTAKKASDFLPYCQDQGMKYLAGAGKSGVSVQVASYTFVAGGVITFEGLGLQDMDDALFILVATNHTSNVREPTVDPATRTKVGFTMAGPNVDDVVHVMVVGPVSGQLS